MFLGGAKHVLGGAKPPRIFRASRENKKTRFVRWLVNIFKKKCPPLDQILCTPLYKNDFDYKICYFHDQKKLMLYVT